MRRFSSAFVASLLLGGAAWLVAQPAVRAGLPTCTVEGDVFKWDDTAKRVVCASVLDTTVLTDGAAHQD